MCGCCSWCQRLPTRPPPHPPPPAHCPLPRRRHAADALLPTSCFPLPSLPLLLQVESSVRLLQLVSVVAEAAGERLQPSLGALAAALPQVCVWGGGRCASVILCLMSVHVIQQLVRGRLVFTPHTMRVYTSTGGGGHGTAGERLQPSLGALAAALTRVYHGVGRRFSLILSAP